MFRIEVSVKDKNLGEVLKRLHGLTTELEYAYIPDHVRPGSNTKAAASSRIELIAAEIHKRKLTQITGSEMKELVEKVGLSRSSYSHYLQNMVAAGLLKKGGKGTAKNGMQTMSYIVTGK